MHSKYHCEQVIVSSSRRVVKFHIIV